jgi:predicted DCC family thiol-disulfide oxidoreductase YuxK
LQFRLVYLCFNNKMNKTIVFYDQSCRMCVGVTGWLRRIDGKKQFQLEPYQDSHFLSDYPKLKSEDLEKEIHLITDDGRILKGADAMMEIWIKTGHWTNFAAYVYRLPPFIWIARILYKLVAKFRRAF